MLVEIVETFKKLSDGLILRPGDVIDVPLLKANRLIEKGRARLLPSGAHGNAPKNDYEGSSEAPLPPKEEMSLPARFRVGDRVRFAHKRALDVLEGIVLEATWYPAPVSRWWYRLQSGERKIWISESHVQQGGSDADHG